MLWLPEQIEASTAETLHTQLSGYGATLVIVQRTLDRSGVKDAMDTWEKETIKKVVDAFLDERFPTIIVSIAVWKTIYWCERDSRKSKVIINGCVI